MDIFQRFSLDHHKKTMQKTIRDIDCKKKQPIGITMNWAGEVTLLFDGGKILPKKVEIIKYGDYYTNPDGWPRNPATGKKLKVVKERE